MRVCYLCADRGIPLDGHKGASAHVRGFVRALERLGHEVRVLTGAELENGSGDGAAESVAAPGIVADVAARVAPRMARALGHLWMNVAVERALEQHVQEFRPDLIYERYSPFSAAGSLVARRMGIPHVLEVNAPLAWEGSRFRRQALADAAEALEQAAFTTAPMIVAVSEELRAWLMRAGIDAGKIMVLPNGVDTAAFSPLGPRRRLAGEDKIVIGFVGSLKPWHGIDALVAAFRELAADPRLQLTIVGDGPEARTIEQLMREYPGRVAWTGAIPHELVPAHVRALDIAVAPYPNSDEFYFSPLKVLEYMAAGVAVVASAIGQIRDLIEQGVTGVLVPPGDVTALATAIRELADSAETRNALGRAAAEQVAAQHSWEERVRAVLAWAVPQSAEPLPEVACSR